VVEVNQQGVQVGALQAFGTANINGTVEAVDVTGSNAAFWNASGTVDVDVVARDTRNGTFDRIDVHGAAGTPCHFWWMVTPSN
jgi:hypothetical protein